MIILQLIRCTKCVEKNNRIIADLIVAIGTQLDDGAFQHKGHQSVEGFIERGFIGVHL